MMLLGLALTGQAAAGTLATLYSISGGADGSPPNGSLIAGPNGSLIGTTSYGGTGSGYSGNGTVFQLLPPGAGQTA